MATSRTYRARQIHRWLGFVIGVQFIFWTLGGLYFSWTDLDAVHGDHLLRAPRQLAVPGPLAPPHVVVQEIARRRPVDSVGTVELATVLDHPTYRLTYFTRGADGVEHRRQLADAVTGSLRPPLSREEAVAVARAAYTGRAAVTQVEYLTAGDVGRHHEYREQPLPAWAVRFGDREGATAYVPSEIGQVLRIRNNRWRLFDLLWMLHTMDYRGRDDFNNLLLRGFSVLGLTTVLSGFVLFVLTSRWFRRRFVRAH